MEDSLDSQRELITKELEKVLLTQSICEKSLELASQNCGFDKNYHKLLFQGGIVELLSFLSRLHDQALLIELSKSDRPEKITKRVALATKTRLKLLDKTILSKICNFYLNPLYSGHGLKLCFKSCDAIWRYAGDQSIDYNYYTKRMLLLSVYLPSIMHYIGDDSINHIKTDQFIDSSLEKIVKLGSLKAPIKLLKIQDIPILRMFV
jgi:ubiquinone biosynthesis protein COQ9